MSAACGTNPLQLFIGKDEQNQRFRGSQVGPSTQNFRNSDARQVKNTAEQQFFESRESHNGFLGLQQPAPMVPINTMNKGYESESWIQQFSSVNIDDPMEFSKEYRDLYANYESKSSFQQQRYPQHLNMYRQSLTGFGSYTKVQENNLSQFDREFQELENELQRNEDAEDYETQRNSQSNVFDDEQVEFQKIANSIVDSCSTISNSPSPVSSKLSGSKFMTLMRGISEGSITLKKDNERTTELQSPINGELVGNEYFPVLDEMHSGKNFL